MGSNLETHWNGAFYSCHQPWQISSHDVLQTSIATHYFFAVLLLYISYCHSGDIPPFTLSKHVLQTSIATHSCFAVLLLYYVSYCHSGEIPPFILSWSTALSNTCNWHIQTLWGLTNSLQSSEWCDRISWECWLCQIMAIGQSQFVITHCLFRSSQDGHWSDPASGPDPPHGHLLTHILETWNWIFLQYWWSHVSWYFIHHS